MKKILFLLFPFLLLFGLIGCSFSEEKMLHHLEKKYNEEFVIESFEKGFPVFGEIFWGDSFVVSLKNNPDIVFLVGQDFDGEEPFWDTYLLSKWSEEIEIKLNDRVKNELPPDAIFKVHFDLYAKDEELKLLKNAPIEEVLSSNIDNKNITFYISIPSKQEPDLNAYSENLVNVYRIMEELQLDFHLLSVGFVGESEDITEYMRTSSYNNIYWDNLDVKVYGDINVDDRYKNDGSTFITEEHIIESYVSSSEYFLK